MTDEKATNPTTKESTMHLTELITLREQEAQKIAKARGRALMWNGVYNPHRDDRAVAEEIVKAGLTLVPRD